MFSSSTRVTVSSGRSTYTSASLTPSTSLALLATSTTPLSTHFGSKEIILFYAVRIWFLLMVASLTYFCDNLLRGWPCIKSCLSLFLSRVHLLYILFQLSCYEGGLCVNWTISISRFTELVWNFYNAWFSVNDLVNLVVLIIFHLLFTELVRIWFSERNSLSLIKWFSRSIFWTRFKEFMNNFW